jgi:hypothetical protein
MSDANVMQVKWTATVLLLCLSVPACSRTTRAPEAQRAAAQAQAQAPAPGRVVAIGDLHGDLDVTRRALRLAGAIGADDHWNGGKLTVVQTGDVIDRGDSDREVLDLLERLRGEASRAGGALIALSGNHEIMNVSGDYRYVSAKSAAAFSDRRQAFAPGGPYARLLAGWPVIAKVSNSIFVHGGVLPQHVQYGIDAINREAAAWMRGDGPVPAILMREDAPVWTRLYSSDPPSDACAQLEKVLRSVGATRMVVGHTPQARGISPACGEKVWRIDTGMSHFYGGPVQVLEIESGRVRVRSESVH